MVRNACELLETKANVPENQFQELKWLPLEMDQAAVVHDELCRDL